VRTGGNTREHWKRGAKERPGTVGKSLRDGELEFGDGRRLRLEEAPEATASNRRWQRARNEEPRSVMQDLEVVSPRAAAHRATELVKMRNER